MLRALQIGISVKDMDELSIGLITDMIIEHGNDSCEYDTIGTNDDMKRIFGG